MLNAMLHRELTTLLRRRRMMALQCGLVTFFAVLGGVGGFITGFNNASIFLCAREIRWLILHGVLHLVGHDHEGDHGEMTALEHSLRAKLKM